MTQNVPGSGLSETVLPPAGDRLGLMAAVIAIAIAGFGIAVSHPLFAVLMERQGHSGLEIGLSSSMLAVAMLIGGLMMPRVLPRLGLPAIIGLSAVGGGAFLMLAGTVEGYWPWTLLRFCFSLCATAIFFGSELWIVSGAPPHRRGFWLGIYGLLISVGYFCGPLVLGAVGTEGFAPFLVSGAIFASAALPLIFGGTRAPRDFGEEKARIRDTLGFFRSDPSLIFGVILYSTFEIGVLGLLPVWGLRVGHEEALAVLLTAMVPLGNMLTEMPLGLAIDRLNRRALMIFCAMMAVAMGILMPVWAGWETGLALMLLVCGGPVVGLYVIPLAEFGSRYSGQKLSQANGAVLIAYGIGALIAPTLLGQAMDLVPPHGLGYGLAILAGAYALLLIWRGARPTG